MFMLRMLREHGSVKVGGKFILHAQWQMGETSATKNYRPNSLYYDHRNHGIMIVASQT